MLKILEHIFKYKKAPGLIFIFGNDLLCFCYLRRCFKLQEAQSSCFSIFVIKDQQIFKTLRVGFIPLYWSSSG